MGTGPGVARRPFEANRTAHAGGTIRIRRNSLVNDPTRRASATSGVWLRHDAVLCCVHRVSRCAGSEHHALHALLSRIASQRFGGDKITLVGGDIHRGLYRGDRGGRPPARSPSGQPPGSPRRQRHASSSSARSSSGAGCHLPGGQVDILLHTWHARRQRVRWSR